jgi:hypothetical protein
MVGRRDRRMTKKKNPYRASMTVGELITLLAQYPSDAGVRFKAEEIVIEGETRTLDQINEQGGAAGTCSTCGVHRVHSWPDPPS